MSDPRKTVGPCGCPWDEEACPHCGRLKSHLLIVHRDEHIVRCHDKNIPENGTFGQPIPRSDAGRA